MNAQDLIRSITGGLVQQDRLLKLDTPLGANALVPQRAVGHSRIGRHFEFTIDVVSTSGSVELKSLIAQPVTLWMQQADKSYLPHNGYVHTARRLGSDSGLTSYQLVFASWMHFLRFRRDQRIWQDKSADEIITDVFNSHPQAQGMFQFALSNVLPSRSYCRQDENDWNFVHRLLESEGLYGFWRQAEDGKSHTLVITDRLQTFDTLPSDSVKFYRAGTSSEADALTQWSGTRTLQSATLTTRTFDYKSPSTGHNPKGTNVPTMPNQGALPDQSEVYEYTGAYTYSKQDRGDQLSRIRMEEWESRAKRFHGVGGLRRVDAGWRFTLTGHPEHDRDNKDQREFAVIETEWIIENNLPLSGQGQSFPHSLQGTLAQTRARFASEATFKVPHADGSDGFYLVEIEAQRTTVPYRSPFEHNKPEMHLESAIVVGPSGEEVFTDELNRIKVQFIWDRLNGGDERASCWVRAAQSDTGSGYGGVHMPRIGEEVLIDHIGGDCDRPVVVSRLYNGATKPQWHSNGLLSGYRSKEYGGSGYNQMVMDDSTGQSRVHLYSSSANSHLHLGYLIQHTDNSRGAFLGTGFDLKSSAYGAIRAGQGLYVSTYPASTVQPLDASQASGQLVNAESVIEAMSEASVANHAESLQAGQDALKAFTDATQQSVVGAASGGRTAGGGTGNANGFSKPILLAASPSGVALSTQQSAQIAADQQVNIVSGQSTHIASGKSLIASVSEKISLFVQNAGMKFFAAKGKVEIQAQSDEMALAALKDVTISSAEGRLVLSASKEVWIGAGGSYIRITANQIENGTPGQILEKCASWDKPAAATATVKDPLQSTPAVVHAGHFLDYSG
ncbi:MULTISPECIES: type VI secretion system Vgr family protein [Paraburkholderia]|uniref:Type VI secretion system secreted protein VgrG n=1 Tax=Paraburkholderia graminis TaxID=60548 RepID=A0ABD5C9T1_9BURK|nr:MULTISPECIES: type VI secretion system Vgr family protein [Paraburkholderia]AXF13005.1 type VI secretion system tip protein VgrG [Paraburkholderia caledonica]MDR6202029.1 type VI secretion system secreted protein VgrG [Paraburkholderia graminis]